MAVGTHIVFPLYAGVTQLDFTGPHQVFSRLPDSQVVTASVEGRDIEADGLRFANLADLGRIERCDVLCVPGGYGTSEAMKDPAYMASIRRLASGSRYVTSVCTGSLILAAAGLLQGKRAACHWAWRDLLALFGAIPDPARVVRDGNVFTAGGVTSGIDFALTIAAEIAGADTAQAIQLTIEYAPAPPFQSGRPETAPPAVLDAVQQRMAALAGQRRDAVATIARSLQPASAA
jgi:cyclohexyl-isocyanide hydratase